MWYLHKESFCIQPKHIFFFINIKPNELVNLKRALNIRNGFCYYYKGDKGEPLPPPQNEGKYYCIVMANELMQGVAERNVFTLFENVSTIATSIRINKNIGTEKVF